VLLFNFGGTFFMETVSSIKMKVSGR